MYSLRRLIQMDEKSSTPLTLVDPGRMRHTEWQRFHPEAGADYSLRRIVAGSMAAARLAGSRQAIKATTISKNEIET